MDLSDTNCTIVFFLTHGSERSELATNDGAIFVNTILEYFNNNRTLDGKPKLFFFQVSALLKNIFTEQFILERDRLLKIHHHKLSGQYGKSWEPVWG